MANDIETSHQQMLEEMQAEAATAYNTAMEPIYATRIGARVETVAHSDSAVVTRPSTIFTRRIEDHSLKPIQGANGRTLLPRRNARLGSTVYGIHYETANARNAQRTTEEGTLGDSPMSNGFELGTGYTSTEGL